MDRMFSKAVSFMSRNGCGSTKFWSVGIDAAKAKKADGASVFALLIIIIIIISIIIIIII